MVYLEIASTFIPCSESIFWRGLLRYGFYFVPSHLGGLTDSHRLECSGDPDRAGGHMFAVR
jgi:hypothetical protein